MEEVSSVYRWPGEIASNGFEKGLVPLASYCALHRHLARGLAGRIHRRLNVLSPTIFGQHKCPNDQPNLTPMKHAT